MTETGIFVDLEHHFNEIYKSSTKTANVQVNEAIKQFLEGSDKGQLSLREKLLHKMRFESVALPLWTFLILFVLMLVSNIAAYLLRTWSGWWSDLILLFAAGFTAVFWIVFSIWSIRESDKAWGLVNLFKRRQLKSELIIEEWIKQKFDIDDLMLAFKSSLNNLQTNRGFYTGMAFLVGLTASLDDLLIGKQLPIRKIICNFTGGLFQLPPYILLGIVISVYAGSLFLISARVGFREQLEPFLVRAIERHKSKKV